VRHVEVFQEKMSNINAMNNFDGQVKIYLGIKDEPISAIVSGSPT